MNRLRELIQQHGHWSELLTYIERTEASVDTDFSLALENIKALIETIGKEICNITKTDFSKSEDFHSIVKKSFSSLGYSNSDMVSQISRSLATITLQIGTLRSEISPTSHGRTLDEFRERNNKVNPITREFLIDSAVTIARFLIRAFEERKNLTLMSVTECSSEESHIQYAEADDFNESWDEMFGEFAMGEISHPASEILFYLDYDVYKTEYKLFKESESELETGE
ncbi:MAG: hypothetical protein BWK73_22820 [Thiothrix lacustris]|uniref:Abortive infection protein-like C-terminal domain-containing protein n=1 Tax=Thiothrix lacustris TaxID=525917 RepID=A0A1Y1QMY3_9GAMM|nr:MAG: hypothetical protein BWK73_22820 [Thiothrix lacustris]